LLGAV